MLPEINNPYFNQDEDGALDEELENESITFPLGGNEENDDDN